MYSSEKDTQKVALLKNEALRYKNIKVAPLKFGQDNTRFTSNKEKNEIYQSLMAVKSINENTAIVLKQLGENHYEDFYDLYIDMKNNGLSKTHIGNLCKIGYFDEMENKRKCLWLAEHFKDFDKKTLKKDKVQEWHKEIKDNIGLMEFYDKLKEICLKETEKQFTFESGILPKLMYSLINVKTVDKLEEYAWELDLLGTTIEDIDDTKLIGRIIKYNPSTNRVLMKHCRSGVENWYRLNCPTHIKEKDYVFIPTISEKIFRGRKNVTVEEMINLSDKYLGKKKK